MIMALIVIGGEMLISIYQYYQPAQVHPIYRIPAKQSDDTLRVLFIGDSWAAYHQVHDSILAMMLSSSIYKPCVVKSIGNVGAKSKEVYERLFSSTKPFILEHPDYCIISAGINDAVAKMGVDYYTSNYMNLLDFLISQEIVPIVLDIPDVDYYAVFSRETLVEKFRHRMSAVVNSVGDFSFLTYRKALTDKLESSEKGDSIIYIKASKWISSGTKYFLEDGIHLNDKGYQLLDSCLSDQIRISIQKQHAPYAPQAPV